MTLAPRSRPRWRARSRWRARTADRSPVGPAAGVASSLAASLVLVLVGVLVVVVVRVPGAAASYTRTVTNTTNSARSFTYATCRAAALGETGTRATLALPLSETTGLFGANDVAGTNDFSYALLGVGYAQPGPCPRDSPASRAVTLDGSMGDLNDGSLLGCCAVAGPQTFSIEIWFRTTVAGGKLIGFGSAATGGSTYYDRHLYVDSRGRLTFGVWPNAYKVVSTPGTVTDGQWHEAVGTLSSAGQKLYLDGVLVASDPTSTVAQSFSGHWRIGYDSLYSWPYEPASYFFKGSVAWASVYGYALSATQVLDHYYAGL